MTDTPAPHDEREALRERVRELLDGIYVCTRDESAWSHGTMGLDDFEPAKTNDDVVEDFVELAAGYGKPRVQPTVEDVARVAFGACYYPADETFPEPSDYCTEHDGKGALGELCSEARRQSEDILALFTNQPTVQDEAP